MRLILLRHGETDWNREGRLQGHDNSRLSDLGVQQASSMRTIINSLAPVSVVSSDLGRARETCEVIGFPQAITDVRLREIGMGEWTGRKKAELKRENRTNYIDWRRGLFTPPGGEPWVEFRGRVYASVTEWIGRTDGDILLVVHSGVVRAVCDTLLGLEPGKLMPLAQGTLTSLIIDNDNVAHLESYNLHPPTYWNVEAQNFPTLFRIPPSRPPAGSDG